MKDDFVKPIAILTIICLVVSAALALTNNVTDPIISAAAAERAQIAMAEIIPQAPEFVKIEHDGFPRTIREAYRAEGGYGYVFILGINGFSGEIRIVAGIDNEGNIISSKTLSHTETRGIGCILDDPDWIGRFDGVDSRLEGISTVTGATVSTVAYIHAIDAAFEAFELIRGA